MPPGRELLEETGYQASDIERLERHVRIRRFRTTGWHSFLARDVTLSEEPTFAGTEHTSVRLVLLADVPALIANGTIDHALVVVAFIDYRFSRWFEVWRRRPTQNNPCAFN